MDKKTAIKILKELASRSDKEEAHILADKVLLDFINDDEIRAEYNNIDKWYS
jgi:hypothetical protein